ncbi:cysteine/serine protease [Perkinsela sp. CCAP 1560/4]|nr:cysteine/serine protease [Perkinsela sp. CCAP 1560/4]|eukprot:KNH04220.1 cysteine/serine protease [Perkinsela sp. CCAP 1560/4]
MSNHIHPFSQDKKTPKVGLSDVTNISTARRHEVAFSKPVEKYPHPENVPTKKRTVDEASDEEAYPPVEFSHPEPTPSPRDLFDIRVNADNFKSLTLLAEDIERPIPILWYKGR